METTNNGEKHALLYHPYSPAYWHVFLCVQHLKPGSNVLLVWTVYYKQSYIITYYNLLLPIITYFPSERLFSLENNCFYSFLRVNTYFYLL